MSVTARADAVIVGAGHNGLVAAILLARAQLDVSVVERAEVVGGAVRTERPFVVAPELPVSTGATALGLIPPELLSRLRVELPLLRREPQRCLPSIDGPCVLFGADAEATRAQLSAAFSAADWQAHRALQAELAALRADLAPTWLGAPLSVEDTAERFVRAELRQAFVDLCRGSTVAYLERFEFRSERLAAMYAVSGGASGLGGGIDEPGSGMSFLVHHLGRLGDGDGSWMGVRGGMGTVSQKLAYAALSAGARFVKGDGVAAILVDRGAVSGVVLDSGREIETDTVVCSADPFRMRDLVGRERLPAEYNARLDGYRRDGAMFKLNFVLDELPELACLPGSQVPFRGAIHLLPDEGEALAGLRRAHADARAGRLPELPGIEWHTQTATDASARDAAGRHTAALYAHWVPYSLAESSWDAEEGRYTRHLLSICDRFAPGTSARVVATMSLPPPAIERRFGMTGGHPHHVDNSFGFADRLPYRTPIDGLYACGAGTHPAGAVIGAAGHNGARLVLADRRH